MNGDGFTDVIVGAYQYDNGQTDEGRAFVYYGNDGDGLDRIPRQARVDDAAPIDRLGLSDSPTSFRIKALGRTPAGRGLVRIQFEIEPLGTPFDGQGLVDRPFHDTGTPGPERERRRDQRALGSGLDPRHALSLATAHRHRLAVLPALAVVHARRERAHRGRRAHGRSDDGHRRRGRGSPAPRLSS